MLLHVILWGAYIFRHLFKWCFELWTMVLCLCWNLYAAFDFLIIFTLVKCVFEDEITCGKAPMPCSYVFAMRFQLVPGYDFVRKIPYCLLFLLFLHWCWRWLYSENTVLIYLCFLMLLHCILKMNLWWRYYTAFIFFTFIFLFLYYTLCMSFFCSEYSSIRPFSSLADGWRWRWRWRRQYLFMLCNVYLFVVSD